MHMYTVFLDKNMPVCTCICIHTVIEKETGVDTDINTETEMGVDVDMQRHSRAWTSLARACCLDLQHVGYHQCSGLQGHK